MKREKARIEIDPDEEKNSKREGTGYLKKKIPHKTEGKIL